MTRDYNKKASHQGETVQWLVEHRLPDILAQIQPSALNDPRPFVVADYGVAGGKNSLPAFEKVVEHVRRLNPRKEMLFFLEDIPENDYNITLATFAEHFKNTPGVFTVTTGKSFYERVFPKDGVDLGMCFNALHWLSAYPTTLPGYIMATPYIEDESVRDAWST